MEVIAKNGAQNFHPKIILGDEVYVGRYCQIYCVNSVRIGDGCVLIEYIHLSDSAYGFDSYGGLIMEQDLESKGQIFIGKNTFVGYGVSIMPGVMIGEKCIIGTRSVVTKSFAPYTMLAASPEKIIKKFDFESGKWILV